jgi:hypothetical protein
MFIYSVCSYVQIEFQSQQKKTFKLLLREPQPKRPGQPGFDAEIPAEETQTESKHISFRFSALHAGSAHVLALCKEEHNGTGDRKNNK